MILAFANQTKLIKPLHKAPPFLWSEQQLNDKCGLRPSTFSLPEFLKQRRELVITQSPAVYTYISVHL